MAESHYGPVIRALHYDECCTCPRGFSAVREIHECKYFENKESRALFTSFTFLIFVPRLSTPSFHVSRPLLLPLSYFLRFSLCSTLLSSFQLRPEIKRVITCGYPFFRVCYLTDAISCLRTIDDGLGNACACAYPPSVNHPPRARLYYKLFCAAQFKSIARNSVPKLRIKLPL